MPEPLTAVSSPDLPSYQIKKASPPRPHICGRVTPVTSAAATAASMALPPRCSISSPAAAASSSALATIPFNARTSGRRVATLDATAHFLSPGLSQPSAHQVGRLIDDLTLPQDRQAVSAS